MSDAKNQFTDAEGRLWVLRVDYGAMKRVRNVLGLDLPAIVASPEKLGQLLGSPIDLIDVAWVVVEPRAREIEISDEQFGRACAGNVLGSLASALMEGMLDFFPEPQKGLIALAWHKALALEAEGNQAIQAALDSGKIAQAIDKALGTPGSCATDSPEPSA